MANNCPNCGGFLKYDIPSGQLKCDSCDSMFEVESYQEDTKAEQMDVSIYTCPNCGAEITSSENSALDYCMYCGSFVTLDQQMAKVRKPDTIIPFAKTKEECKKSYKKMIGRKIYAPKEFRNDEFLEGFKGIYIPYWSYTYDMGPEFHVPGKKVTTEGDYTITQRYDTTCKGTARVEGLNYDASSTFDDAISERVAKVEEAKKKPFHPGYMFGFFGDTADVEAKLYRKDANELATRRFWDFLFKDKRLKDGYLEKFESDEKPVRLPVTEHCTLTMMPVWFLTWRKDDKVAYSVMNGQTGKIYSEVPVDTKRYLLFSLITAIPIFFLLNMMITFSGDELLMMSMFLSTIFMLIYSTEIERIAKRVLHVEDKGYLSKHAEEKKRNEKEYGANILTTAVSWLFNFFFKDGITGYVFLAIALFGFSEFFVIGLIVLVIAAPIYTIYRVFKVSKVLGNAGIIADFSSCLFSLILSLGIFFCDPANDIFYYGSAIVCLLAVGFMTVRVMMRHNEVITRPVPHFFDRKEGMEE